MYDLVIYDGVGRPFRGDTVEGIGGAEHYMIKLASSLAEAGLKVAVLNSSAEPEWRSESAGGVVYRSRFLAEEVRCKTLLLQRATGLPGNVDFEKLVVQVHDAPDTRSVNLLGSYLGRLQGTLVCVSEYQRRLYPPDWSVRVGGSFLHELPRPVEKDPHLFVFASAAMKGHDATVAAWKALREAHPSALADAKLHLIASGYDRPLEAKDPSLVYVGKLGDEALFGLLNRAAGIFYVNVMPETYGLPMAMAARLGTRVHALCVNGVGGMREAARDTDLVTENEWEFRAKFLQWYGELWPRPPAPPPPQEEWRQSVAFWKEVLA